MSHRICKPLAGLFALACLAALLGGCVAPPFDEVALGTMGGGAVRAALGGDALPVADGFRVETRNPWPTVIGYAYVAVPEGGAAQWKLAFTGRIVHLIFYQTLTTDVVYEGPLPEEVLAGLHNELPPGQGVNEFQARLVEFIQSRVTASMPLKWKKTEVLQADPQLVRFMGVHEALISDLRGRGKLTFDRFHADIQGDAGWLRLNDVGEGRYRLEVRGTTSLGPVPVL